MRIEINEIVEEFEYRGYKAIIKRLGHVYKDDPELSREWLTGYVLLDKDHKYYGIDNWDALEKLAHLHVHGGINYASSEQFDSYAIGFDCGHGLDTIEEQNQEYVKQELKSLIVQL